jgi:histidinol-phosphate/aromatic aminotransferase/cobyric acid decarboxylase-like protein
VQTIDPGIRRAAERVALACRALSAAADDLAIAARRDGADVDDSVDALQAERERVCELSEELSGLARSFGTLARAVG